MNFEEKVRSMSPSEIIMAMVKGLEKPYTKIDMSSYGRGHIQDGKEVCYGCAATNAICEIVGKPFSFINISDNREGDLECSFDFLDTFECALDYLRTGRIESCNRNLSSINLPVIKIPSFNVPPLCNQYTQEELDVYKRLAKFQDNPGIIYRIKQLFK